MLRKKKRIDSMHFMIGRNGFLSFADGGKVNSGKRQIYIRMLDGTRLVADAYIPIDGFKVIVKQLERMI